MVIKKVGVLSLGKISGAVYGMMGLLVGFIFAAVSLLGGFGAMAQESSAPILGMFFGVGAIIIFPVMYGVMGFIGGLLTALLYNLTANLVGGIEIET